MALSQARNEVAFTKSAAQFNVAESDFLILESMRISSYEGFALRVPSKEDLEEFMRMSIVPSSGYKGGENRLMIFARAPAIPWQEFRISEDAAALRKLWLVSKEICKAELERLATGDDATKGKINIQTHLTMEDAAVQRGMPKPGSDVERPSLYSLNKVSRALIGPSATYEYQPWEIFINLDDEMVLGRAGKLPKVNKELVMTADKRLSLKEEDEKGEHLGSVASDLETMRNYLEIRARCYEMLEIAPYPVYKRLTERYVSKLIGRVPKGMRPPTLEEVRRFDRTLDEELLRWLSRNVGSLDSGVNYHLENEHVTLWKLLDPVIESLPDQGLESEPKGLKRKAAEDREKANKAIKAESNQETPSTSEKQQIPRITCLICKKKHLPLCPMPEAWRRERREKAKARKKDLKTTAAKSAAGPKK